VVRLGDWVIGGVNGWATDKRMGGWGDRGTRRQGDKETGGQGDWVTG